MIKNITLLLTGFIISFTVSFFLIRNYMDNKKNTNKIKELKETQDVLRNALLITLGQDSSLMSRNSQILIIDNKFK